MEEYDYPVTSPTMPVDEGLVYSPEEWSNALTLDLTDSENQQAFQIMLPIIQKYQRIFQSAFRDYTSESVLDKALERAATLVDRFEDEIKTQLAEKMNLLVSVDMVPVFEGGSPTIVLEGALEDHYSAEDGFDHERKEWEVKKANALNQPFLGADKLE